MLVEVIYRRHFDGQKKFRNSANFYSGYGEGEDGVGRGVMEGKRRRHLGA